MTMGTAMISSTPIRLVPLSKWWCNRQKVAPCLLLLLYISACSSFLQQRTPSATMASNLYMSSQLNYPGPGSRTWNQKPRKDSGSDKVVFVTQPEKTNKKRTRQKTMPMPITGYDANAIEHYYDRRPLQVGWRLNSLGFPLLGTLQTMMMVMTTMSHSNV